MMYKFLNSAGAKKLAKASVSVIAVLMLNNTVLAADVNSVSAESFAQYGREDAYWIATVSCEGGAENIIQRKTDGDSWCPKGALNLCSTDKDTAAKNACSDDYTQLAKAAKERELQAENAKAQEEARRRQQAAAAEAKQREAAAKPAPVVRESSQETIQEKILIQEERIKIEQEKLQLRSREIELEKRAVEIEELLKDTDSPS